MEYKEMIKGTLANSSQVIGMIKEKYPLYSTASTEYNGRKVQGKIQGHRMNMNYIELYFVDSTYGLKHFIKVGLIEDMIK